MINLEDEDRKRAKKEFKLTKDKVLGFEVACRNRDEWVQEIKDIKEIYEKDKTKATKSRLYWDCLIELYRESQGSNTHGRKAKGVSEER